MAEQWRRIYTDLDGTLLDHHTYDWKPASAALSRCRASDIPVIPSTSKTADEVEDWIRRLDLPGYGIAENGGIVLLPQAHDYWRSHAPDWEGDLCYGLLMTRPYGAVCQWIDAVRRAHGFACTGFHDVDVTTVMAWTGLDAEAAAQAMQRQSGEALVWEDTDQALDQLRGLAAADNWVVRRGGRFVHVGDAVSKASAMQWLESHLPEPGMVLALGDSENDREMLEAADMAVVIRNDHGRPVALERSDALYSQASGPQGWADAVVNWLERS